MTVVADRELADSRDGVMHDRMGTSRRHEEARSWHDGTLDETTAVEAVFETLHRDQGWNFGGWMETKIAPLESARSLAKQFRMTLLDDGETFYVQDLGKSFETRPEISGALESVVHYASLIAEMLMDGRVEGRVLWTNGDDPGGSTSTKEEAEPDNVGSLAWTAEHVVGSTAVSGPGGARTRDRQIMSLEASTVC